MFLDHTSSVPTRPMQSQRLDRGNAVGLGEQNPYLDISGCVSRAQKPPPLWFSLLLLWMRIEGEC